MTEQPCLFFKMPEAFYCRIHADVRLSLTDERCRRGAGVSLTGSGLDANPDCQEGHDPRPAGPWTGDPADYDGDEGR
jgi:hypothetical protein